jgi:ubiquinone/menaquinone biosynthesis C-methylase UbiE
MSIHRVYQRFLRRRRLGFAYDMAKEIAQYIPMGTNVVDIGCGNGFIAYHLGAMVRVPVMATDIVQAVAAPIDYRPFTGSRLPFPDHSFDVALFCYVLHHAPNAETLLAEARRVLRPQGRIIVYEDTPKSWIDRLLCWRHERQWLSRAGRCSFRADTGWRAVFARLGFTLLFGRSLSRFRDLSYPVSRSLYVLSADGRA